MKRILCLVAVAVGLSSCGVVSKLDSGRLIQGGVYAAQALTLTDAQVENYVHQYIQQLDAQSVVLPESSPYTQRLRKIINSFDGVNELPLNFKVYQEKEINAFACADGSVRVYSGIMDVMTDEELAGVLGHEMGHVALHHTRKQMQKQMLTSAALQGIASAGDNIAALTDSQLEEPLVHGGVLREAGPAVRKLPGRKPAHQPLLFPSGDEGPHRAHLPALHQRRVQQARNFPEEVSC